MSGVFMLAMTIMALIFGAWCYGCGYSTGYWYGYQDAGEVE